MDRRKFLLKSGVVIGSGALLSACNTTPSPGNIASAAELSFNTWEDIRRQFFI